MFLLLSAVLMLDTREVVVIKDVLASDLVVVDTATEQNIFVSLLGVGGPETIDAKKPAHLTGDRDLLWTAKYLKTGMRVYMERKGITLTGRLLALFYRMNDNLCWNQWLIKSGGAFFTSTNLVDYSDDESSAKQKRIGIWSTMPDPIVAKKEQTVRVQTNFTGVPGGKSLNWKPRYAKQDWSIGYPSYSGFGNFGMGINPNQHHTRSYYRSDGTLVHGYTATNPNSSIFDNFSYRGNR